MNFKYILLSVLGLSFVYVLLMPRRTMLRKAFILAFLAAMLLFAFNPDWSTTVANQFGIGRGADFLFYISHLMIFFIAFIYYLKFKDIEIRFARLVRHLAIVEAREPAVCDSADPRPVERQTV